MTVLARDLIQHSMDYEPKGILTGGTNSMCLGEIPMFHSP